MIQTIEAHNAPPIKTPDGAERRVLAYGVGLMLVQFNFAAHVASWAHSHPHEQVGYVVSGEIDYIVEGQPPVRLRAGGSYYAPSNVTHHIVTYAPTILIDAFAPAREDFLT
ncbi:MAG: cupin domain-containing protein [Chloroflexi bacterium]|nr:cupin domain-containing protein [Chloroflexota bacterium]